MAKPITSFTDFWPYYLGEHAQPATRAWHYVGTSLVIICALAAIATGRYWLFAVMPFAGYGFAWASHALVERNRPATFTYPLWSLAADFKMFGHWITGTLSPHLERAGVASRAL